MPPGKNNSRLRGNSEGPESRFGGLPPEARAALAKIAIQPEVQARDINKISEPTPEETAWLADLEKQKLITRRPDGSIDFKPKVLSDNGRPTYNIKIEQAEFLARQFERQKELERAITELRNDGKLTDIQQDVYLNIAEGEQVQPRPITLGKKEDPTKKQHEESAKPWQKALVFQVKDILADGTVCGGYELCDLAQDGTLLENGKLKTRAKPIVVPELATKPLEPPAQAESEPAERPTKPATASPAPEKAKPKREKKKEWTPKSPEERQFQDELSFAVYLLEQGGLKQELRELKRLTNPKNPEDQEKLRQKVVDILRRRTPFVVASKVEWILPPKNVALDEKGDLVVERRKPKLKDQQQEEFFEETGHGLKGEASLDGQMALYLNKLAGFVNAENPKYVFPGSFVRGAHNINTGNRDGFVLEKTTGGVITEFVDHHHDLSQRDTGAARLEYERLRMFGLLTDQELARAGIERPVLERALELVTTEDNKSYPEDANWSWENNSSDTAQGLAYRLSPEQVLNWVKMGKKPTDKLSVEELRALRLEEASSEQKKYVENAKRGIEWHKRNGFVVETENHGPLLIAVNTKLSGGIDAVRAFLGKKAVMMTYNTEAGSAFISTTGEPIDPEITRHFDLKILRETMAIHSPRHATAELHNWRTDGPRWIGGSGLEAFLDYIGVPQDQIRGALRKEIETEKLKVQFQRALESDPRTQREELLAQFGEILETFDQEENLLARRRATFEAEEARQQKEMDALDTKIADLKRQIAEAKTLKAPETLPPLDPERASEANAALEMFDEILDAAAKGGEPTIDFISQDVAEMLNKWGTDETGKKQAREFLRRMIEKIQAAKSAPSAVGRENNFLAIEQAIKHIFETI